MGAERRQHHLRPRRRDSRARLGLVFAGEQTLSSAVQAGIGLLVAWGLVALFPVLKRQVSLAFAFCGVAILAAAGAMLAFPSAF